MKKFHYQNNEKHIHGGKLVTRKVYIKNGKGYKSETTIKNGKRHTTKRRLTKQEIENIKNRKFIRGLFSELYVPVPVIPFWK